MNDVITTTCRRCGACCAIDMTAYVSPEDIERWENEGRHDILDRLNNGSVTWAGDRMITKSGSRIMTCYYLNWDGLSFFCEIYETRPQVCRNYVPGSSELCPLYFRKRNID